MNRFLQEINRWGRLVVIAVVVYCLVYYTVRGEFAPQDLMELGIITVVLYLMTSKETSG